MFTVWTYTSAASIAKCKETGKCKDEVRCELTFIWIAGTLTSHNSGRQREAAALSYGVKLLGREADHSTQSSSKVNDTWRYIYLSN